jgi:hypothetical protein
MYQTSLCLSIFTASSVTNHKTVSKWNHKFPLTINFVSSSAAVMTNETVNVFNISRLHVKADSVKFWIRTFVCTVVEKNTIFCQNDIYRLFFEMEIVLWESTRQREVLIALNWSYFEQLGSLYFFRRIFPSSWTPTEREFDFPNFMINFHQVKWKRLRIGLTADESYLKSCYYFLTRTGHEGTERE